MSKKYAPKYICVSTMIYQLSFIEGSLGGFIKASVTRNR